MKSPHLTSTKNESADDHRSNDSRSVGNQSGGNRVARPLHTDCAEVNGNTAQRGVEREERQQERDGEQRDGIDRTNRRALTKLFWRRLAIESFRETEAEQKPDEA